MEGVRDLTEYLGREDEKRQEDYGYKKETG